MKNIILFLLLFTFNLGELTRLTLWQKDLIIHFNDLLIGIITISYFLLKLIKKEKIFIPKISYSIFIFFLIAIVANIFSLGKFKVFEVGVGSLYLFRWLIYALFFLVVFNFCRKKNDQVTKILEFLILTGTVFVLMSFVQFIFLPDLTLFELEGWDPHLFRLTGTLLDPNFTGAILVFNLIIIINVLIFKIERRKIVRIFYILTLIISFLGIILTYSRSTYLMLFFSFLPFFSIYSAKNLKKALFFITVIIIISGLVWLILPKGKSYGTQLGRQKTFLARIDNWRRSLVIIKENPLLGVGFNNFRYAFIKHRFTTPDEGLVSHAAGADNSFLFVIATTGIIGFGAYLWLWISIIKSLKLAKNNNLEKFFKMSLLSSLIGIFVQSFFINSLFYPQIMEWLWVLIALKEASTENI